MVIKIAIILNCPVCGKQVKRFKFQMEEHKTHCCSNECKNKLPRTYDSYINLHKANIIYDYIDCHKPLRIVLERYGITKKALYNAFHRWGIDLKERKHKRDERVITALKYSGLKSSEVRVRLNISKSTFYDICKRRKFNLLWRQWKLTPERKAKLNAEGLNWVTQRRARLKNLERGRRYKDKLGVCGTSTS